METRPIKLDRKCPRCCRRLYHTYQRAKKMCYCANCGHEWFARLMAKDL